MQLAAHAYFISGMDSRFSIMYVYEN